MLYTHNSFAERLVCILLLRLEYEYVLDHVVYIIYLLYSTHFLPSPLPSLPVHDAGLALVHHTYILINFNKNELSCPATMQYLILHGHCYHKLQAQGVLQRRLLCDDSQSKERIRSQLRTLLILSLGRVCVVVHPLRIAHLRCSSTLF